MNRYRVNYVDKKVHGKVSYNDPSTQKRRTMPGPLCHRGLIKLAEIALDVRQPRNTNGSMGTLESTISKGRTMSAHRINMKGSTNKKKSKR